MVVFSVDEKKALGFLSLSNIQLNRIHSIELISDINPITLALYRPIVR